MKVSINWLKQFVDCSESPQQIAERLTMSGIEVESLVPTNISNGSSDWILEVAVPPNRGDCLSVIGLGREVAAIIGTKPRIPRIKTQPRKSRQAFDVKIENPLLCPRYSGRFITNLQVAASPTWLRARLESCGIRSLNNVVDVTNFVMLETGQPLHAFDWDKLQTKKIVVRAAGDARRFTTLDGLERELDSGDLLICDGDVPIALAGIMGGMDTEVSQQTVQVLLESAHFDPMTIRRTAKRLGLHSEASYRFERFVDPEGTLFALERAATLLTETASGKADPGILDRWPHRRKTTPIVLRDSRVRDVTGMRIERKRVERLLTPLGLKIRGRSRNALKLISPSYRNDLTREVDLIEEVVRLNGYEKIPAKLPLVRPQARRDAQLVWERKLRSVLSGHGLTQVVNLTFTSAEMNRLFQGLWDPGRIPVAILNPLSQDSTEMRFSLLSNLVANLRAHAEQRARGLSIFEMGKVFSQSPSGKHEEKLQIAGLCYGFRERVGLSVPDRAWTFLEVKGIVEGILDALGVNQDVTWTSDQVSPFVHPGKGAFLCRKGCALGLVGEIHPDLSDRFGLPRFSAFELDFERSLQYARPDFTVRPLPRFPSVERDVALVVEDTFLAGRIVQWIRNHGPFLIEDVRIFDEYHGAQVAEGMKSLAYRISYRAEDRTLTDAEVNEIHQSLIEELVKNFGAQVRQ